MGDQFGGPTLRARVTARTRPIIRRFGPKPLAPRLGGRVTGYVESVRDWSASTAGASYEPLIPAATHERRPAKTLTPRGRARIDEFGRLESPEAFRCVVPDGRVVDTLVPLVLTADRRVLWESAYPYLRTPDASHRRLHSPRPLPGRYMTLLNQFWDNHFHWVVDTLPRISLLPLAEEPSTPILVPATLTGTQRTSLEMLGVTADRLVPFDHTHIQVDELVFPSFVGEPAYPPPWAMAWLRDHLAPPATAPATSTPRRIWVSRGAATRGRVTNEREVLDVLAGFGFEHVLAETLSFAEQLQLFSGAELIVAPHGSGLANLVAASHATVIELQSDRWWGRACYYTLADSLDLAYWYMHCQSTRWEHLVVDTRVLAATIEAALEERQARTV